MSTSLPYPGLRPFHRDETDIFFGREEQADQLVEKLSQSHFLSVVGSSGCGKSSLVRAGMIASLEAGFMSSAGAYWHVAEMRPGSHPLKRLSAALLDVLRNERAEEDAMAFLHANLRRGPLGLVEILRETPLPEQANLLLLVDQFEEIFRYRKEGSLDEADAFISLLIKSASQREFPIYVVITMRSDFLGDCAVFSELPKVINESQFLTPRLTREQCQSAIAGPARVFGGDVDAQLVNNLLNDMGTDSDQLPLMQHLMMRMWTQKQPEVKGDGEISKIILTHSDYKKAGGLARALSIHADEAFKQLDKEQQKIAQVLFRCLSERSSDKRDTRRPVVLEVIAKVAGVSTNKVEKVIEVFRHPNCNFLTPAYTEPLYPNTIVDISHESLISQWERMNEWVEQEAKSAEQYHLLEKTASKWHEGNAALWRTPDLEYALEWKKREQPSEEWAKRYGGDFELAMKFLDESEKEQKKREAEEEQKRKDEILRLKEEESKKQQDEIQKLKVALERESQKQKLLQQRRSLKIRNYLLLIASVFLFAAIVAVAIAVINSNEKKRTLEALSFHFYYNNIAVAFDGVKYGFIGEDGKPKIDYMFDRAEHFNNESGTTICYADGIPYFLDARDGSIKEYKLDRVFNFNWRAIQLSSSEAAEIKWNFRDKTRDTFNLVLEQLQKNNKLKFLFLHDNEITILPQEITSLINLRHLQLSNNLIDSFPLNTGNLTNLYHLDLANNKIINCPFEIGTLRNLRYLDLSNNQLENLPAEIGNLKALEVLKLSNNKLEQLPESISMLTNLKVFEFSNNPLSNLPKEIGNLKELTILNITNTKLCEIPPSIGNMSNLKELKLINNQFENLPSEVEKLSNLESLYISDTSLRTLPPEIGNLKELKSLILYTEQLSNLPDEISNLHNLKTLIVMSSKIPIDQQSKLEKWLPDNCDVLIIRTKPPVHHSQPKNLNIKPK